MFLMMTRVLIKLNVKSIHTRKCSFILILYFQMGYLLRLTVNGQFIVKKHDVDKRLFSTK